MQPLPTQSSSQRLGAMFESLKKRMTKDNTADTAAATASASATAPTPAPAVAAAPATTGETPSSATTSPNTSVNAAPKWMQWVRGQNGNRAPPPLNPPRRAKSGTGKSTSPRARGAAAAGTPPPLEVAAGDAGGNAGGLTSPLFVNTAREYQALVSRAEGAAEDVDERRLREIAANGIPDDLRGVYWRLLLSYLPTCKADWGATLDAKRAGYRAFCEELVVIPDDVREAHRCARRQAAIAHAGVAAVLCAAAIATPERVGGCRTPVTAAQREPPADTAATTEPGGATPGAEEAAADADATGGEVHVDPTDEGGDGDRGADATATDKDESPADASPASEPETKKTAKIEGEYVPDDDDDESEPDAKDQDEVRDAGKEAPPPTPYERDQQLLQTIDKDVPRTMPSMHFFNKLEDPDEESALADMEMIGSLSGNTFTKNQLHLRRLLFIFVKLNPGLNYVQGMNEVAGHLFYTLARANDAALDQSIEDAEADAFFCFTTLIAHLGDNFCRALDRDRLGIEGSLSAFEAVLARCDPELSRHLDAIGLQPCFYGFRWVTLLLSQEFMVTDVLRVWDFFFADVESITTSLYYACTAMLVLVRDTLLRGDFASNMQLLQDYPPMQSNKSDGDLLVDTARKLMQRARGRK